MRFTCSLRKMAKLFANSGDPDQTSRSAASDLDLHCLPIILLRVSRLQWVKFIAVLTLNIQTLFLLPCLTLNMSTEMPSDVSKKLFEWHTYQC